MPEFRLDVAQRLASISIPNQIQVQCEYNDSRLTRITHDSNKSYQYIYAGQSKYPVEVRFSVWIYDQLSFSSEGELLRYRRRHLSQRASMIVQNVNTSYTFDDSSLTFNNIGWPIAAVISGQLIEIHWETGVPLLSSSNALETTKTSDEDSLSTRCGLAILGILGIGLLIWIASRRLR